MRGEHPEAHTSGEVVVTVVIAFEQALERDGLMLLLKQSEAVSVVAEASNGHEAVSVCRALAPDVLLIDPALPTLDAVLVTQRLRQLLPGLRVLAIGDSVQSQVVAGQLAAGAAGYLSKRCHLRELITAILAGAATPVFFGHDIDTSGLDTASFAAEMATRASGAGATEPTSTDLSATDPTATEPATCCDSATRVPESCPYVSKKP